MRSLHEAFETVLQFLEVAAGEPARLGSPLALAAVRTLGRCVFICWTPGSVSGRLSSHPKASQVTRLHGFWLCRYLAEVPEAHAERVRALLPALLSAGAPPPGQLPDVGASGLPAVQFLLPMLSQVAVLRAHPVDRKRVKLRKQTGVCADWTPGPQSHASVAAALPCSPVQPYY